MQRKISFPDFNMKIWKNFGIFLMIFGLIGMFVVKAWRIGGGIFLAGLIFTVIFQGHRIFKILKKKNW